MIGTPFELNHIPWNKGKRLGLIKECKKCKKEFYAEPRLIKKRKYCSHMCQPSWNKDKKGLQIAWNKDLKTGSRSLITKQKISSSLRGFNSYLWKGGKPDCKDCGKKLKDYKAKRCISCFNKTKIGKQRPAWVIKKMLRRRTPSSLEVKFQTIINKYNLPYKFVGNGKFFIENINPDFVNTNGEKIAIEVYAKSHKDEFREGGEEGWKEKRLAICKKYGWDIFFLESHQLTEEEVIKSL